MVGISWKYQLTVLKLKSGYDFEINNFKGALFCKKKRSRSYGSYSLHVWCCLIFVPSFMKISLTVLSYRVDKIFIRNISKGHNFAKIVGGVPVLVLCTLSETILFLYIVSWKYLWWFLSCRVDTIFIGKFSKGHNSVKCRWSYGSFSRLMVVYVQSFMKIFSTVLKLKSGHDFHRKKFKAA